MSHWTKAKTKIQDLDQLKDACEKLDINLEIKKGSRVRGYEGNSVADAVIKGKKYDIGFKLGEDGCYEIVTDHWGLSQSEGIQKPTDYLNRIKQEYSAEGIRKKAGLLGYSLTEDIEQDGTMVLKIRRY